MKEINLEDKYSYELSNWDILIDKLENHLNIMEDMWRTIIWCLISWRLKKV